MSQVALDAIRRAAIWFEAAAEGFDPLLESIGDAQLVLIGEATHGTHEFYRARAELTKATAPCSVVASCRGTCAIRT